MELMTTYWAELDTNKIVTTVFTGVDDATIEGVPTAEWYTNFTGVVCVQTYLDTAGKNFAGAGYTYDAVKNNFIAPQPYPSWTLDNHDIWQPPIPQPPAPPQTYWNEQLQKWIPVES